VVVVVCLVCLLAVRFEMWKSIWHYRSSDFGSKLLCWHVVLKQNCESFLLVYCVSGLLSLSFYRKKIIICNLCQHTQNIFVLVICLLWFVSAHTTFCPCHSIEKNYFLFFVLTHLKLCHLWFMEAHTSYFVLIFCIEKNCFLSFVLTHPKPLLFVICGSTYLLFCSCLSIVKNYHL
jgi:hypothetical protein